MEAGLGMITGIVLGLIYCWPVALIALGIAPLLMVGAMINAKAQGKGGAKNSDVSP